MSNNGAEALHRDSIIIDGLIWHTDGDTHEFRDANVAAINLTIQSTNVEASFEVCCDDLAHWLVYLRDNQDRWALVLKADDIPAARRDGKVGMILGWQNARALDDNLDRIVFLHRLGLRIMQPSYNTRTFLADGCLEPEDGGLSALGKQAIKRMNEVGIAVDMSHSSERSTIMAAEVGERPILITHVGAKAVANLQRNKSDDAIKAVAETGGVIGIGIYGPLIWNGDPLRRPTLDDFRRHLNHIVELVGIDHVGLGTDQYQVVDRAAYCAGLDTAQDDINPGAAAYSEAFGYTYLTRYPTDCETIADYPRITDTLVDDGWSESDVRKFWGGNFLRAFGEIWVD